MDDDHALWHRWCAGDRGAGQELYLRHYPVVARVFEGKLRASIDDLVQRTFLRALESAGKSTRIRSVRAYLAATARNLMFDRFREAAGPRGRIDPMTQTLQDAEQSFSGVVARARDRHALLLALRRIPLDAQLLLELFYWEGLSGDELAEAFGVPVGTIRTRLRRARKELRGQMSAVTPQELASLSQRPDFSGWAAALKESSEDES